MEWNQYDDKNVLIRDPTSPSYFRQQSDRPPAISRAEAFRCLVIPASQIAACRDRRSDAIVLALARINTCPPPLPSIASVWRYWCIRKVIDHASG